MQIINSKGTGLCKKNRLGPRPISQHQALELHKKGGGSSNDNGTWWKGSEHVNKKSTNINKWGEKWEKKHLGIWDIRHEVTLQVSNIDP